jgi:toxin ParE1/3/4
LRIEWRDEAKADAREALAYIAQDNLAAAYGVYGEIEQQVALLADFPKMGRSGRVKGTRELVITRTPYIVAYRVKGDTVQVLRVLHGAQQWPRRFAQG